MEYLIVPTAALGEARASVEAAWSEARAEARAVLSVAILLSVFIFFAVSQP